MKNFAKLTGIIAFVAMIGFSMAGCEIPTDGDSNGNGNENGGSENNGGGGNGSGGTGGSNAPGSSKNNARAVTVGHSSSYTISKDGKHWFTFTGTGDTVIFETTGNVVDTYIDFEYPDPWHFISGGNDNGGEGYNASVSVATVSGTTYWFCVETRQGTSGTYTLLVRNP